MNYTTAEYPALIYKSKKSNVFVANCIMKNLVGYGRSEKDALLNLETVLNKAYSDYPVKIRPVYNFLSPLLSSGV